MSESRRPEVEPRPGSLKLALVLIALAVLVECYHQFASLDAVNAGEISGLEWLIEWFWVGVVAATGLLIARCVAWARWVLLAIALHDLYDFADALLFLSAFDAEGFGGFVSPLNIVMIWAGPICSVTATILVFGPGRGWFARG